MGLDKVAACKQNAFEKHLDISDSDRHTFENCFKFTCT